ncbi:hypothetical protein Fcan01_24000 [Folsomia candida]|uniref:Uncharacterized protein n=1 Tax=Folsomia candida TaxID=158441 RepID=A0A226D7S3_FOLCA|nr:hypothetical protein Fcan01_24000 [Folsomia candida]
MSLRHKEKSFLATRQVKIVPLEPRRRSCGTRLKNGIARLLSAEPTFVIEGSAVYDFLKTFRKYSRVITENISEIRTRPIPHLKLSKFVKKEKAAAEENKNSNLSIFEMVSGGSAAYDFLETFRKYSTGIAEDISVIRTHPILHLKLSKFIKTEVHRPRPVIPTCQVEILLRPDLLKETRARTNDKRRALLIPALQKNLTDEEVKSLPLAIKNKHSLIDLPGRRELPQHVERASKPKPSSSREDEHEEGMDDDDAYEPDSGSFQCSDSVEIEEDGVLLDPVSDETHQIVDEVRAGIILIKDYGF